MCIKLTKLLCILTMAVLMYTGSKLMFRKNENDVQN